MTAIFRDVRDTFLINSKIPKLSRHLKITIRAPTRYRKGYLVHFHYIVYMVESRDSFHEFTSENRSISIRNLKEAAQLIQCLTNRAGDQSEQGGRIFKSFSNMEIDVLSIQPIVEKVKDYFQVAFLDEGAEKTNLPNVLVDIVKTYLLESK